MQNLRRSFRIVQITFENIRSAQPQHSGVVKRELSVCFRFAYFRRDSGRKSADRSHAARWLYLCHSLLCVRCGQIDADYRRGLREPVAFEHFFLEAFFKMAGEIERQFFSANDDEAQGAKLLRLSFTQIQSQERGCRQQERQLVLVDQSRALRGLQWIGKCHDAHTLDERIPKCHGRAEGVKEWQRAEDGVGFSCVEQLAELRNVSDHIAVTYHNAFRLSGGSACKKQDRFGVTAVFGNLQKPQEQPRRSQHRYDPPKNDLAVHMRQQFIQLQDFLRPRKIFESFHERRG